MREEPSFYAVIPIIIMRDKRLKLGARLLYGEITSLSNKEGFCWASNKYFAELYDCSKDTISRWIAELKECEHISVELVYQKDTKIIENRIIRLLTYVKSQKATNEQVQNDIPAPKVAKVRPQKAKKEKVVKEKKEVINKNFDTSQFDYQNLFLSFSDPKDAEKYWKLWQEHKIEIRSMYSTTRRAILALEGVLSECKGDTILLGEAVRHSIASNYKGLYHKDRWQKQQLNKQENADLKRQQTSSALDAAFDYLNR